MDEACEGKFYPNEAQLEILGTFPGKKFIESCSKRHRVEGRVNWIQKAVILNGLPDNNEKFLADLEAFLKRKVEEKRQNILEHSQKLPRNRHELIDFIENSVAQLDKNLGNIQEIYRKLKILKDYPANFHKTERLRRLLNIMLLGQAGLRDGAMHLSVLKDKLSQLRATDDENEIVPDNVREEIEKHWRYIFSSQVHNNYDQMIRQYFDVKRAKTGGNIIRPFLNTVQQQQMAPQRQPVPQQHPIPQRQPVPQRQPIPQRQPVLQRQIQLVPQRQPQPVPQRQLQPVPQRQPQPVPQRQLQPVPQRQLQPVPRGQPPVQPFHRRNDVSNRQESNFHRRSPPNWQQPPHVQPSQQLQNYVRPQNSLLSYPHPQQQQRHEELGPMRREQRSRLHQKAPGYLPNPANQLFHRRQPMPMQHQYDDEMGQPFTESPQMPAKDLNLEHASSFWSKQCVKEIAKCMAIQGLQGPIKEKLLNLLQQAGQNMISMKEFQEVKKLYFNLLRTVRNS